MRHPLENAFAEKPLAGLLPPPAAPEPDASPAADPAPPPDSLPEPSADLPPAPAPEPDPEPISDLQPDPPDPSDEDLNLLLESCAPPDALREVPPGWQASLPAADEPPELAPPPAAAAVALPAPDEPPPPTPKWLLPAVVGVFALLAAGILAGVWFLGSPNGTASRPTESERPAAWVRWGTLLGRSGSVGGLTFGRDGALAAGSPDGSLRLWLDYRVQPFVWQGYPNNEVSCAAFDPAGIVLATGAGAGSASEAAEVRLWWAAVGRPLRSWQAHQGGVGCIAFSPDGRRLATGGGDQAVRIWETATGLELFTLRGHANPVVGIAFSPDGNRLVTAGGWDQTARIWDLNERRELFVLRGHSSYVEAVAFSPNGKRIATGEGDRDEWGRVHLWDAATGGELPALSDPPAGRVTSVAFSPDGKWLACGSRDGTARLWSKDGAPAGVLPHGQRVDAVTFRRDGELLATASADGTVRLWRQRDGAPPDRPTPPGPAPVLHVRGGADELAAGDSLVLNLVAQAPAGGPVLTEYHLNDGPWQSAWPAGQVMLTNLGPGILTVEARAVGPRGELSAVERRSWTVAPRNRPPVLALVDLGGEEIYAGDRVWLHARALCWDPDGDRLTCRWRLPGAGPWHELPADGWFEVDGLPEGEAAVEFQAADGRQGLSEPVSRIVAVAANPKARTLTRSHGDLRWADAGKVGRLDLPPLLLSYDFDFRIQVRPGDFGNLSLRFHSARGGRDLEVRLEDEGNKVAVTVQGETVQRLDLSGKNALWLEWGRRGGVHRLSLAGKEVVVKLPPQAYNGRVTLTTTKPALTEVWELQFAAGRGR